MEITKELLERRVTVINRITNRPRVKEIDGRFQVGHYSLGTDAKGLYTIREILSPRGDFGRIDTLGFQDHKTDREMLCWIEGLISGVIVEN